MELAHRVVLGAGFRILQYWNQAHAVNVHGLGKLSQIRDRSIEIDQLYRMRIQLALRDRRVAGFRNHQNGSRRLFIVSVFAPHAMITEVIAVVTPEDDDRILELPGFFQCVEELAET